MVHGCNGTCAETAAVSRGTSHVTTKQRCKYTTSVDIQKRAVAIVTRSESYSTVQRAVSLLGSRKQRHIKTVIIYSSCEPVWPSGKALDWEAEGPRFDSASAVLSLQKGCGLWFLHKSVIQESVKARRCLSLSKTILAMVYESVLSAEREAVAARFVTNIT